MPEPSVPQAGLTATQLSGDGSPSTPAQAGGSSRRRVGVVSAVVAIVVVATTAVTVAIATNSSHRVTQQATLSAAVSATTARRTAAVVLSGHLAMRGISLPISGTGAAVFGSGGGFSCTFAASAKGVSIKEQEIVLKGRAFLRMTMLGHDLIGAIAPGKRWLEIPVPVGAGSGVGGGAAFDPLTELQLLSKKGYAVQRIGTSSIDGHKVTGYRVVIDHKQMAAAEQKAVKTFKVP
ncbi:MAG: hypothetical protein ACYDBS_09560, partial [Acidimicrobiales bacterium]